MDAQQHARMVSFIWHIADDALPMTVIRRLDALHAARDEASPTRHQQAHRRTYPVRARSRPARHRQIPFIESVDAFIQREVLPDASVVDGSRKTGYQISFTHYYYRPQYLRTLAKIEADIRALEGEAMGLFEETLVEVDFEPAPATETV